MKSGFFVLVCAWVGLSPEPVAAMEAAQWRADLDFVVDKVTARHANPWDRVRRADFMTRAESLSRRLGEMDDVAISVELMRLVALLEDGHTELSPTGEHGFRRWYPLRFHRFADGIYLTALPPQWRELGGLRVTRINGRDAVEVIALATELWGADNRFHRQTFAFLASSADLLEGLGVVDEGGALELEFETASGPAVTRSIDPADGEASLEWRFWGEMFGPQGVESVSAMGPESMDFLSTADPARPSHLRQRSAYSYHLVPDQSLIYFSLGYLTHQSRWSEKSLEETFEEALIAARDNPAVGRRLVIDLRYNIGGDGSMVHGLVNLLLRRYPFATQRGHVFLITGPVTFSAGVMMAAEILEHVPVVIVGTPMGAPLNAYGDAETYRLPNSGFELSISRRWWQLSASDDRRRFVPVQVPAPMTGADYFAGRDPALAAILDQPVPYPTLGRIVVESGGAAAEAAYRTQREAWSHLDYWQPVGRLDLEYAADALTSLGRIGDAVSAYRINTWVFPDDWDTWDDLGQVCAEAGDSRCVVDSYRRALRLNPTNWNAADQRRALAELGD